MKMFRLTNEKGETREIPVSPVVMTPKLLKAISQNNQMEALVLIITKALKNLSEDEIEQLFEDGFLEMSKPQEDVEPTLPQKNFFELLNLAEASLSPKKG